jgi:hypothetical protein
MAKRTVYISEDEPIADIFHQCPLAHRILERHFGRDFVRREDLDQISLKGAVTLFGKEMHSILMELNRTCI